MKTFLSKLGYAIAVIILLPMALFAGICYLISVPFDIIRYHSMPYYKDFKIKYRLLLTSSDVVKMYNYIARKKLPIEYVRHNDFEYFIKDGEVLLCGQSHDDFEETEGEWYFVFDGEDVETKELIEDVLNEDIKLLKPEHQSLTAKYLLFYDDITDAERFEKAKECPYFYCVFSMDEIG